MGVGRAASALGGGHEVEVAATKQTAVARGRQHHQTGPSMHRGVGLANLFPGVVPSPGVPQQNKVRWGPVSTLCPGMHLTCWSGPRCTFVNAAKCSGEWVSQEQPKKQSKE